MSARTRVYLNVALAVVAGVGIVVGLTLDTRTDPAQPATIQGKPPVPTGIAGPAGVKIEQAFRNWPNGSIDTMQQLGLTFAKSAIVQYYRGVALLWAGYPSDAEAALEQAKKLGRNTYIQGKADNILHPNYYAPASPPYYPVFVPTERSALLQRGSLQQAEGHQVTAETLYRKAARLDPGDPQAQVAVAVGLFDEDNIVPTFSMLGPLTARFPRSQSVHYYLGYLLSWTDQKALAVSQYEDTVKLGPGTVLGRAATEWLDAIAKAAASSAGR